MELFSGIHLYVLLGDGTFEGPSTLGHTECETTCNRVGFGEAFEGLLPETLLGYSAPGTVGINMVILIGRLESSTPLQRLADSSQ